MRLEGAREAAEVESQLFRSSPRYLLAAFSQAGPARERDLADTAQWLSLDAGLEAAGVTPSSMSIEDRWLGLLSWCGSRLESETEAREVRALVRALRDQAAAADKRGRSISIDGLWTRMSEALEDELSLAKTGDDDTGPGTRATTLRGRKWAALRTGLARVLAGLVDRATPTNLLPREPRQPSTFTEAQFEAVRAALGRQSRGAGLAVVAAPPGAGKGEFALAYATRELRNGNYDRVFVLRATDSLRLEQDFMMMAKVLVPDVEDPPTLRREALRALETSGRWLIVCHSVGDPAILLPFLPWNPDGHVLCTYWPDADAEPDGESRPWLQYFDAEVVVAGTPSGTPALLEPLSSDTARAFIASVLPSEVESDAVLEEVATLVSPSRLGVVLTRSWLEQTALSVPAHEPSEVIEERSVAHAHRQLEAFLTRWRDAGGASGEDPGARVSRMLLWELDENTRWRSDEAAPDTALESAALTLLIRLEVFAAGSFPLAVLDDPTWTPTILADDHRLALLERWGLADRANHEPHAEYFEVSSVVRDAVRALARFSNEQPAAVASASLTLLRLMQGHTTEGRPADRTFELLVHAEAVALREVPAPDRAWESDRPLVAIELLARAAIGHLTLGRLRTGKSLMERVDEIFVGLRSAPTPFHLRSETWAPVGGGGTDTGRPADGPTVRMGKLVKSLRTGGFAGEARQVYRHLENLAERSLADGEASATELAATARLHFEGAMAAHDRDDISAAEAALTRAENLWRVVGDERWLAAASNFAAELQFDAGDYTAAGAAAEQARATRMRLLGASSGLAEIARAHAELARSYFLLGRIAYCEGRLVDAKGQFAEAIKEWRDAVDSADAVQTEDERPTFPSINAMSARSHHALMTALLGDGVAAESAAAEALVKTRGGYPRERWSTVTLESNYAQILRLNGDVIEAYDRHARALSGCERMLGVDHRTTRIVRRKCAESALDAGRPQEALALLRPLLARGSFEMSTGEALSQARAWTSLGRLLVENSLAPAYQQEGPHVARLKSATEVLSHARALYEHGADGSPYRNPGLVHCLLSVADIAARTGSREAVATAQAAYELAAIQSADNDVSDVTALTRLVRAQALALINGEPDVSLDEVRTRFARVPVLTSAEGEARLRSPSERLEVALTGIAVRLASLTQASGRNGIPPLEGEDLYKAARADVALALAPLVQLIGDSPHQLIARGYSELAGLAHRISVPRRRARNERERDRYLPALDVDLFDVYGLMVAHEARLGSAPRNGVSSP